MPLKWSHLVRWRRSYIGRTSLKGKDEKFGAGLAFLYLDGKHPGRAVEQAVGYVNLCLDGMSGRLKMPIKRK